MCTQRTPYNHSEKLYEKHSETISMYLQKHVLPALKGKQPPQDVFLLKELQTRWQHHTIMNKWMREFFMYLDRYFVKHHNLKPLSTAGLTHFKTLVYDECKTEVADAMLIIVDTEREGNTIDRTLMKQIVSVFETMGLGALGAYNSDLEEPLLVSTRNFYGRRREEWIAVDSTPDYLVKAEKALNQEKERVGAYFNLSSESKVLKVCEEELLENCQTTLLEKEGSGCKVLLSNDKTEDLERMFKLFNRLDNGLVPMAAIVKEFIESVGMSHISTREAKIKAAEAEENDDPDFVKALLATHAKYVDLIKAHLSNHPLFQQALKDAFATIMNNDVGSTTNAELISTYCDRLLKAGGEKLSEAEIEHYLDSIVELFTYLRDKDYFGEVFRNQLAKRLLNQKSASDDLEKSMISKLKAQVGSQFTSKMEGMMNDLTTADEHDKLFKDFQKLPSETDKCPLDTSVQVLTTGNWPSYKKPELLLPKAMQPAVDQFERYFKGTNEQRRITWMFSLGTVKVKATFFGKEKKSYDLELATLQGAALLAFEDGEELTFEELSQKLDLKTEVLKPVMHSLCCGKFKVIAKNPANNKVKETDKFSPNAKFKNNNKRVKIPMASLDSNVNTKKVEEDRSVNIDASLVRIMKSRKTLGHQALVAEVLEQMVLFKPDARAIKKRIESLLEREYLERSENGNNVYNYLA
ncbi:hypothetical protein TL16_g08679, partial [Triparma laevis f. inornata]